MRVIAILKSYVWGVMKRCGIHTCFYTCFLCRHVHSCHSRHKGRLDSGRTRFFSTNQWLCIKIWAHSAYHQLRVLGQNPPGQNPVDKIPLDKIPPEKFPHYIPPNCSIAQYFLLYINVIFEGQFPSTFVRCDIFHGDEVEKRS